MQRFDITLKTMLQRQLQGGALARLMGFSIREWLNAELPEVRTRHVDLLGRTDSGKLVQVELQSFNDAQMALRMAEYALAIYRRYGAFPLQVVLYVDREKLAMKQHLKASRFVFECDIVDIRSFEPTELLESPSLEDNILAVLTRFSGKPADVRQILNRIAAAPPDRRKGAVVELMILAGLRQFGSIIEEEIKKMPIVIDLNTHTVFGPHYRRGLKEGLEKGLEKGIQEGMDQGVRQNLTSLITHRFGKIPVRYARCLNAMSSTELQALSDRLFSASTISELFGQPA